MRLLDFKRLDKELGLFDVYVICVGAMISSGFFILPGLAARHAGAGVVLAYIAAGFLIVPAMLSQAELATAMPRAGGAYYFLDRTLGPLVGTIGGVGTWLTMVLKSAFALIGMGAYLALVFDVPVTVTAVGWAVLLAVVNVAGARASSGLLRIFVLLLLAVLAFFILHGGADLWIRDPRAEIVARFKSLLPNGSDGLLEAIGLVFVSFIGLTKVASLAEEVRDPDRNIPLGMTLGLLTVTVIYAAGVFVMVATLGPDRLSGSLTPVADAAGTLTRWLPSHVGVWLMVGAAIVAFASMANAGILAASRYPLAMGRDRLFPDRLAVTNASGTPIASITLTCLLLVAVLVALPVEAVAKLASSLQLLLFALINVAVIVMRESRIESYDPGFRAPLYPWLQLVGIFVAMVLVAEMGWLSVLFTSGVTAACVGWYNHYARARIERDGAIFHVFERLGRRRFAGIERELRGIMKEKGLRAQDPFDELVAASEVLDHDGPTTLPAIVEEAAAALARRTRATPGALEVALGSGVTVGEAAIAKGAALLHTRLPELQASELVVARCRLGVTLGDGQELAGPDGVPVRAVFFLVSGESDPGRHLRILAQLASRVENPDFLTAWMSAPGDQDLKEILLRDERFVTLRVAAGTATGALIGRAVNHLDLPSGSLVALIGRDGRSVAARGHMTVEDGDRLTVIGSPEALAAIALRYPAPTSSA